MTCKQKILEKLCNLPFKWANEIAEAICIGIHINSACNSLKDCESISTLSDFTVNGTNACITYKDEKGTSVIRCFNFVNQVYPKGVNCNNQEITFMWQSIVDKACVCCG